MPILGRFVKQSSEVLDYDVDFSDWLTGRDDLPQSHSVVVESGIQKVLDVRTDNVVKVVLSGGTDGQQYKVTVVLTTDTGLIKEADFVVRVRNV